MRHYKTPLPRAFSKVVEFAIGQVLKLDPASAARVSAMQGHVFELDLLKLEITLYLRPAEGRMEVRLESNTEPDAQLSGSPLALLNLAHPDLLPIDFNPGRVKMSGDVELAKQLDELLKKINPDWEEAFCQVFGDIIGHQLYRGLTALMIKGQTSAENFKSDLGNYLTSEDGSVAHPKEIEDFAEAVDHLRDDSERLAARVQNLSR
ncbi:MAG: ubiquinone biosynthesis accessory factor UbiJ [bacterium]